MFGFLLIGCATVGPLHTESKTFEIVDLFDRAMFDLHAGDVTMTGDPLADTGRVVVDYSWRGETLPELEVMVEGVDLMVHYHCVDFANDCIADVDLVVPSQTKLAGSTGAGDLFVDGLDAGVEFTTGAGDASFQGVTGDIAFSTGAGDVFGNTLGGDRVILDTGSGDVVANLVEPFTILLADSGAGNLQLGVPAGAYALTVETGAGDITVTGVTDDPMAAASITATTGAGDIVVTGQ